MTVYPPAVRYYRKDLETRRFKPRDLYETLSTDIVDHDPSSERRMKEGVYNLGKSHWGINCDHITFTFVWTVKPDTQATPAITGGTCISYFESPERKDINILGQTSLSIRDIERAGKWLCQYAGCHHVLWKYRSQFVDALLYLILDFPEGQLPNLKFFTVSTV